MNRAHIITLYQLANQAHATATAESNLEKSMKDRVLEAFLNPCYENLPSYLVLGTSIALLSYILYTKCQRNKIHGISYSLNDAL